MDPPPNHPTGHLDSACSSPRSHQYHNESLPPVPGARLRLVCSYGGHIIPRPHDKALCYVGGDTRMVVIERSSSLADLSALLSRTLLDGRKFTLKYQLPNEDLDSLISVATDEDLQNMIEEYDRISLSPKLSRLRLFLFFSKPETVVSMGSLLDDAKSETWFVDALNGSALIPRGFSDSAAIDGLLELDNGDVDAQKELADAKKRVKNNAQEVMDTSSAFGSSSSTPSMANLPPIKVRVEDAQMVRLDEHFSLLAAASGAVQKQDEELALLAAHPPLLPTLNIAGAGASNSTAVAGELGSSRILSDDERSDQGAPTGMRKPPLPLQVQKKIVDAYNLPSPDSKLAGGFNLPSPDSVASDSSIASVASLSKHPGFQDPTHVTTTNDTRSNILDPSSQTHIQQVQDPAYALPPQQTHQQFVHSTTHYFHHPAAAAAQIPISSYYQMYAPPSQQQLPHQIDQQYYLLPVAQTQVNPAYNFPPQANIADATAVASSRPPLPPTSTMVAPSAAYKEAVPPIYPAKAPAPPAAAPALLQVTGNQFQQQYVGVAQVHHPSQPIAAASAAGANYGVEYNTHPTHDQFYYAQHPAPPPPTQYQTMTTTAAAMFSQASAAQLLADNSSQQIRTSQPL